MTSQRMSRMDTESWDSYGLNCDLRLDLRSPAGDSGVFCCSTAQPLRLRQGTAGARTVRYAGRLAPARRPSQVRRAEWICEPLRHVLLQSGTETARCWTGRRSPGKDTAHRLSAWLARSDRCRAHGSRHLRATPTPTPRKFPSTRYSRAGELSAARSPDVPPLRPTRHPHILRLHRQSLSRGCQEQRYPYREPPEDVA